LALLLVVVLLLLLLLLWGSLLFGLLCLAAHLRKT
jgi:hypothetical protein